MIDPDLRRLLVCPVDHAELVDDVERRRLECSECHRRYPVEDGIPVMLVDRAEGGPE